MLALYISDAPVLMEVTKDLLLLFVSVFYILCEFSFETMAFKRVFMFICNCKTSTISGPLCIDSVVLYNWPLFHPGSYLHL